MKTTTLLLITSLISTAAFGCDDLKATDLSFDTCPQTWLDTGKCGGDCSQAKATAQVFCAPTLACVNCVATPTNLLVRVTTYEGSCVTPPPSSYSFCQCSATIPVSTQFRFVNAITESETCTDIGPEGVCRINCAPSVNAVWKRLAVFGAAPNLALLMCGFVLVRRKMSGNRNRQDS